MKAPPAAVPTLPPVVTTLAPIAPTAPPPPQEVTTSPADRCPAPLTCNLNCYAPTSAKPVSLPGATGSGTDVGVPDLTFEECRAACRGFEPCEAVVHTGEGKGTCYGKREVRTSAAEGGCQTQPPFVTDFVCGAPWGKCTLLGDPHITPFDRKMMGSYPANPAGRRLSQEDNYMVPIDIYRHGEFHIVESAELKVRGRFGYTKSFTSATSTIGVLVTGPLIGGHTLAVAYVGPEPQTPAYKGWTVSWDAAPILAEFPSTFEAPDGQLTATFRDMEPTEYAVRARSTIGTAPGLHPSYLFELGAGNSSVQVYVLPGPDLCNVVITMKKLPDMTGFCGNFDCDWTNDGKDDIRRSGLWEPVPPAASLFPAGMESPHGWDVRTGPSVEEVMASCPPSVHAQAGCHGTAAEKQACLFDACMEHSAHGGVRLFEDQALPVGGLLGRGMLGRGSLRAATFCGTVAGLSAVLYMWKGSISSSSYGGGGGAAGAATYARLATSENARPFEALPLPRGDTALDGDGVGDPLLP